MPTSEWVLWGFLLFAQQFTFLFSARAKNSGSLRYSALAGLGSHGTWFFAQVFFISVIVSLKGAPLLTLLPAWVFYTTFTILGTVTAQVVALQWERGKMKVGAR